MENRWEKQWEKRQILFSWAPKSLQTVTAAMKLKDFCSLEKKPITKLDRVLKSRDINFADKCPHSQSYGLSSSHVRMRELDHKEG